MRLKDILKNMIDITKVPTKEYQNCLDKENKLKELDFELLDFIRKEIEDINWIETPNFLRFEKPKAYAVARMAVDKNFEYYFSSILKIQKENESDYFLWPVSEDDFIDKYYRRLYDILIQEQKKKPKKKSKLLKFPSRR